MHIKRDISIIGTVLFSGEVSDVTDDMEAYLALNESIFNELSQHLDCSRLTVGGMTWDEYQARRLAQEAKEIV
jgi:hypothetical protein